MERILKISYVDAFKLFNEFLKNELVVVHSFTNSGLNCYMGSLLYKDWDIISKHDKNFSTWMEEHPEVESIDSFKKRMNDFIKEK